MTHNNRCANAKNYIKYCKCSCHGQLHNKNQIRKELLAHGNIILTENMGVQIADIFRKSIGKKFECQGVCGKEQTINELWGYEHDGGWIDKDGKKWWVYYHCDKCGYETSWNKIDRRLR